MMRSGIHFVIAVGSALTLLLSFAGAQQMTPEQRANQQLEEYRKSRIDVWMNDFGELGRYREANTALGSPAPGEKRVVFMGDSITDGWNLSEYFPAKPYVNRGIGGQTTPQMLIRFRPDVIDLHPRLVVILAGTNDIGGNTGPMRLEDIENNIASMAELARVHDIGVILASVLPVHNYTPEAELRLIRRPPAKIPDLNRWLKDYCTKNHCLYLDYFSAMVNEKGMLRKELAQDGLHPNDEGYKVMAPLAEKAIEKALAER